MFCRNSFHWIKYCRNIYSSLKRSPYIYHDIYIPCVLFKIQKRNKYHELFRSLSVVSIFSSSSSSSEFKRYGSNWSGTILQMDVIDSISIDSIYRMIGLWAFLLSVFKRWESTRKFTFFQIRYWILFVKFHRYR